jgi:hypothetical protein
VLPPPIVEDEVPIFTLDRPIDRVSFHTEPPVRRKRIMPDQERVGERRTADLARRNCLR